MRVLITGNMGYVGPAVVAHFRTRHPDAELIGFDSGYFAHCLTGVAQLPEHRLDRQIFGDVRRPPADLMHGVDAVLHLAGISNDPIGVKFESVTNEINHLATVRLGEMARDAGVTSFTFASSCSVYGVADERPRRETDPINPVTAYAKSKIASEIGLAALDAPDMSITCLRFATACGMSDRLRLDLVLNDFVACALSSGEITVLSDGKPWRPLIDVADMARALEWGAHRRLGDGDRVTVVNASRDEANYQVRDLAHAVASALPGTRVSINTSAPADSRSYKVDFGLFRSLAPDHQPQVTLEQSIAGLVEGLTAMGFSDSRFRESNFVRLRVLDGHLNAGRLASSLDWAA